MEILAVVLASLAVLGVAVLFFRPYTYLADTRRRINEVEAAIEDLYVRVKSLHGRKAQAAHRENDAEAASTTKQLKGETTLEWKRRVQQLVREGKVELKHGA